MIPACRKCGSRNGFDRLGVTLCARCGEVQNPIPEASVSLLMRIVCKHGTTVARVTPRSLVRRTNSAEWYPLDLRGLLRVTRSLDFASRNPSTGGFSVPTSFQVSPRGIEAAACVAFGDAFTFATLPKKEG